MHSSVQMSGGGGLNVGLGGALGLETMVHMVVRCAVTSAMLEPKYEYVEDGSDAIAFSVCSFAPPKPTLRTVTPASLQSCADAIAARSPPYCEFCSPSVSSTTIFVVAAVVREVAEDVGN